MSTVCGTSSNVTLQSNVSQFIKYKQLQLCSLYAVFPRQHKYPTGTSTRTIVTSTMLKAYLEWAFKHFVLSLFCTQF